MYRALLFKPETITVFPMLYRPSLVLSRQKKAGLNVKETDFFSIKFCGGLQRDQVTPGKQFCVAEVRAFLVHRVKRAQGMPGWILIAAEGSGSKAKPWA